MIYLFLGVVVVFGIAILVLVSKVAKKRAPTLKRDYFQKQWMELLSRVRTSEGMVLAIIDADKLLDEALRKSHYRGKTTGERLVAAQRILSDNDTVWYAHKLRNRLVHETNQNLKKREVQNALAGFRQALRDLGAL